MTAQEESRDPPRVFSLPRVAARASELRGHATADVSATMGFSSTTRRSLRELRGGEAPRGPAPALDQVRFEIARDVVEPDGEPRTVVSASAGFAAWTAWAAASAPSNWGFAWAASAAMRRPRPEAGASMVSARRHRSGSAVASADHRYVPTGTCRPLSI